MVLIYYLLETQFNFILLHVRNKLGSLLIALSTKVKEEYVKIVNFLLGQEAKTKHWAKTKIGLCGRLSATLLLAYISSSDIQTIAPKIVIILI